MRAGAALAASIAVLVLTAIGWRAVHHDGGAGSIVADRATTSVVPDDAGGGRGAIDRADTATGERRPLGTPASGGLGPSTGPSRSGGADGARSPIDGPTTGTASAPTSDPTSASQAPGSSPAGPLRPAAGSGSTSTGRPVSSAETESTSRPPGSVAAAGPTITRAATTHTTSSTNPRPSATGPASTATTPTTAPSSSAPGSTVDPTVSTSTSTPTSTPASTSTTTSTATSTSTSTATTGGAGASGRELWREDFDSLDTSRWRIEHSTFGDGNNELQCYRPRNVSVGGGRLVLRAVSERYTCPNGSTRQVTSGMVRSRGLQFSPGQALEFRVKLTPADEDDQGGLWPAVWSSSFGPGSWPAGGELDYLEVMTAENARRAMFSMHYADPSGRHALQNRGVVGSELFSRDWHTIRFEYGTDGVLSWYLDGRLGFRVDHADTSHGYPAPFDRTIDEIRINLALGGRPGPLSPGALGASGATFEVDYIRAIRL